MSGGRLDARGALEAAIAAPEPAHGLLSMASVATTLLLARLRRERALTSFRSRC